MSLNVPNLDDRAYTDLVAEAVSLLPRYAPEWTNHNASDPGITVIELLAYFTEMLIYRLNRVTRENKLQFLRLLGGDQRKGGVEEEPEVDEALRQTVLALQQPQRAVTEADYEQLTKDIIAKLPSGAKIRRFRSFLRKNLELSDPAAEALDSPGHVSVVIAPETGLTADAVAALLQQVREQLEPLRLLATRLHVVPVRYLSFSLRAILRPDLDADFADIQNKASEALQDYFCPWHCGGPNQTGWPFGRPVYLSEVYAVLEKIAGVVSVQDVSVVGLHTTNESEGSGQAPVGIQFGISSTVGVDSRLGCDTPADTERLVRDTRGRLTAVTLKPWELVKVSVKREDIVAWKLSRATGVSHSSHVEA
jgi:hypothetical protein